jgi:hypothetical protein
MGNHSDMEKPPVVVESSSAVASSSEPSVLQAPFDKAAERRLLWRLDLTVMPLLWLLYLVCFVDRSNIGNAKIQGMDKELKLVGQKYNVAVFVFNIGYVIAGVPLSIAFKKIGPKFLPMVMFAWGKSCSRSCLRKISVILFYVMADILRQDYALLATALRKAMAVSLRVASWRVAQNLHTFPERRTSSVPTTGKTSS